jgi:hypothetical protein
MCRATPSTNATTSHIQHTFVLPVWATLTLAKQEATLPIHAMTVRSQ